MTENKKAAVTITAAFFETENIESDRLKKNCIGYTILSKKIISLHRKKRWGISSVG